MISAKNTIRITLINVALLCLSISFISLIYINQMSRRIYEIAEEDAKMAEMGEWLSISMLEARRDEKNFIIYQDTLYIQNNLETIRRMRQTIEDVRPIALHYYHLLDSVDQKLSLYKIQIDNLKKILNEDPRTLSRLQKQFELYEKELAKINSAQQTQEKNMASALDEFQLSMVSISSRLSIEKSALFMDLKLLGSQIAEFSQQIADKARASLFQHSQNGIQYSIKAQRNLFTLLFIIGLILIYMIYTLPRRIFEPYGRMIRALEALGRGDTEVPLPKFENKSEFSQLSLAFEDAINRLQTFSKMKTDKIITLQRNFNRLLEDIEEPVLVLASDFVIKSINYSARSLFNEDIEYLGKNLQNIESLWEQLSEHLLHIEKSGKFDCQIKIRPKKKKLTGIPISSPAGKLENIILVIHP